MTPRTRARQALLSSTASRSLIKFMLVASMTLSSHLVLRRPLLSWFHNFPTSWSFPGNLALQMVESWEPEAEQLRRDLRNSAPCSRSRGAGEIEVRTTEKTYFLLSRAVQLGSCWKWRFGLLHHMEPYAYSTGSPPGLSSARIGPILVQHVLASFFDFRGPAPITSQGPAF